MFGSQRKSGQRTGRSRWFRDVAILSRAILLGVCLMHCQGAPQRTCESVRDCLADEACQAQVCVSLRSCTSVRDCLADESCVAGICQSNTIPQPKTESPKPDGGSPDAGSPDHIKPEAPPTGCRGDADCATGMQCRSGSCVPKQPPTGCRSNADCASGQRCDSGRCVASCQSDCKEGATKCDGNGVIRCVAQGSCWRWEASPKACSQGQKCKAGKCVSGCSADADCPNGGVCHSGQCTRFCFGDKECDPGYRCIDQKCAVSCTSNDQCLLSAGFTCESGQCLKTFTVCRRSDDCPGGYLCDSAAGRCQTTCQNNAQCKQYFACTSGKCVDAPRCAQHVDCANGFRCGSNGRCKSRCSERYDCQISFTCSPGGTCEPQACTRDRDCPNDLACVNKACKSRCLADTDCRANYMCNAGKCEEGCKDDSNCSGFTCDTKSSGRCYSSCYRDADCKTGLVCDEKHECVTPCSADADCGSGYVCSDRRCKYKNNLAKAGAECDPKVGCVTGYACLNTAYSGKLYRCRKTCTRYCSSSYDICAYPPGASSGQKGCFRKCSYNKDCSYVHKYKYVCSKGYCQVSPRSYSNGTQYDRCEEHSDCAKGYYCIHASAFDRENNAVCMARCSSYGSCGSGQVCRTHNGSKSTSGKPTACFYRCTSSNQTCPTIAKLKEKMLCGFRTNWDTDVCHVDDD